MPEFEKRAPGVTFTESLEEANATPSISNSVAIVGTAMKGPLTLSRLTSVSTAKKLYGEPHANNSAMKAVLANLATNGEVWFQRVVSRSASKAKTFGALESFQETSIKILAEGLEESQELRVEFTFKKTPVEPSTVLISVGSVAVVDNGSGVVSNADEGITGTINYETGAVVLNFIKPYPGSVISATYLYQVEETVTEVVDKEVPVADEALPSIESGNKVLSATLVNKPVKPGSLTVTITGTSFGSKFFVDNGEGAFTDSETLLESSTVDYETGTVTLTLATEASEQLTCEADYTYTTQEEQEVPAETPWIVFATQDMTELYNGYTVTLSENTNEPTKIRYTLSDLSGSTVETYNCAKDPNAATFIGTLLNRYSSYVNVTIKDGYKAVDAVPMTVQFKGGNSGLDATADDIVGTGSSGMKALFDSESVDFATLVVPTWHDKKVWDEAVRMIDYRKDIIYIPCLPFGLTSSQVADLVRAFGEYVEIGKRFDHTGVFVAWPNGYINNPNTGNQDLVDISPYIAATFAASDNASQIWFAPAGVKRGVIQGIDGLEYRATKEERDMLYDSEINVNCVVDVRNHGICIMGAHTSKVFEVTDTNTSLRYINVRRLCNYIRKIVIQESMYNLFDQNDSYTWNDWVLRIDPHMRAIRDGRGVYDYKVIMDETTVTQEDIDAGRMPGIIRIAAEKPGENIDINFVVAKDGTVSFDEAVSNSI